MKKDIHPEYHADAIITCACGNVIHAPSTLKEVLTEICSACHPFFTGKTKLIDSAGRVDKFRAREKAAAEKQGTKKPTKKEESAKTEA